MDVDRLLRSEEEGWRELHGTLDSIPSERLEEPSVTPDGWSAKDVMFHVGAWLAECAVQLERMRMGTFDGGDLSGAAVDRMNRDWLEISRSVDVPTARVEFHAARVRMMQEWGALAEITPDAWEWFEESGPNHYAEHLTDILAWLAPRT
jgi:hypothetical protein